jgi:hypothetical protein
LTRDKVRLQSQLESLLEECQIKLSSVVSDLLGASGQRILRALAQGETDPARLAEFGTVADSAVSVLFVFLTFFPPGLMKSFLTIRTGNAWVHLWAFHAISPHVTVDTRLIVHDFHIR